MADTDDVQDYASKFDNQLAKVRESDIDERDREAILGLVRLWDSESSINQGTIVSYMNRLRLSSERADTPLVDVVGITLNCWSCPETGCHPDG